MVILDKCNGSCNAVDDLSMKIRVQNKTKNINNKVSYMITGINKLKLKHWLQIFHVTVNANSMTQYLILIKKGIMINVNASLKSILHPKML